MGMVKKDEIRKTERYNFACTPEMVGIIHTTSQALGLSPSELLRKLIIEKYNELTKNRLLENLNLEGDSND